MTAETGRSLFFLAQDERKSFHASGNLPINPLKAAHEIAKILTEKGYEEVTLNVPARRDKLPAEYSRDSFGVLSSISADLIADNLPEMKVNYTSSCSADLGNIEYEAKSKCGGV